MTKWPESFTKYREYDNRIYDLYDSDTEIKQLDRDKSLAKLNEMGQKLKDKFGAADYRIATYYNDGCWAHALYVTYQGADQ